MQRICHLFCISLVMVTLGCDIQGPPPAANRPLGPPRPEGAPEIPERFVWRPSFNTTVGSASKSQVVGSAFAVDVQGSNEPIIVTALHLFGPATGLETDIHPTQWRDVIERVALTDAFGSTDGIYHIASAFEIADESEAQRWIDQDLIAFHQGSRLGPKALKLADLPEGSSVLPKDQRIWMVTAVYGGASPSQKCHEARVISHDQDGKLVYRFAVDDLSLRATEGAPLVTDAGEVIGIHLGGTASDEGVEGWGNAGTPFQETLQSLFE
ncbi:hypothetical protein K227x_51880 [Rubripirellula lacrimiformis]|uniref:Trypsin n=1 Tax=Rubripirellula lacrimiformis TaxID=1930273 RepID=A0A517NI13_9BACT|nr:hypothetical protein [Rubripirellula lacrimiformis]QDT06772.1 hypothetical protein K227x_51880 [Rubripirellula lacrimiformis]